MIRKFWNMPAKPVNPGEMPFLDHLEELRLRLVRSLVVLAVCVGIGFFIVTKFDVLALLIKPVAPYLENGKLRVLNPADPFFLTLQLSLVIGLLLALPIVVQQFWGFISPALLDRERKAIIPAFYLGLVLFMVGAALAYFVALPVSLRFFMGFQVDSLQPDIVAREYLGFVVKMLLGFGLIFEMPVVIMVLTAVGIVNAATLAAKRRHAMVINVVLASVITPGDVIVLTLFLMVPLILLYEVSIKLSRLVERRREARIAEFNADLEAPAEPA